MTESILGKKTLTEVADLNSAFLDLLVALGARCGSVRVDILGLDPALVAGIDALPRRRRAEMAHCPFTLFSLRLDDPRYWDSAEKGQIPAGYRDIGITLDTETGELLSHFCLTALLFARHMAVTSRFNARLMFGMPLDGSGRLEAVPLVLLQHLASVNTGLLTARFADHPRFWPDLIWCAAHGSRTQRAAARMLGAHLLSGRVTPADDAL